MPRCCYSRRAWLAYTHRTIFVHLSILVVGVLISTIQFGLHHDYYSTSNAVSAAVNGLCGRC